MGTLNGLATRGYNDSLSAMSYTAALFKLNSPNDWMVYDSKGGIIGQNMSEAHAITLAGLLNFAANALKTPWLEDEEPPVQPPS